MRRKFVLLFCLTSGLRLAPAQQPPTPRPFRVVRLDPALDDIISADAKLETLGEHFGLTEGPVWIQEGRSGYLLFSDCAANVIYKWSPNAPLSVFLEKSGYTGTDVSNVGDQTVITAMTDRDVTRLEKDGTRTVLADRYQGKLFIPAGNDGMKVDRKGNLYAVNAVGPGEVWITSPEGKHLGPLELPQVTERAEAAHLRHQSGLWRRGLQDSIHHILHSFIQGAAESGGHKTLAKLGAYALWAIHPTPPPSVRVTTPFIM